MRIPPSSYTPNSSPSSWIYSPSAGSPLGNRVAFHVRLPLSSRSGTPHPQSVVTYRYPSASSPRSTSASALDFMIDSLGWQL
jgi:hypothetical protein